MGVFLGYRIRCPVVVLAAYRPTSKKLYDAVLVDLAHVVPTCLRPQATSWKQRRSACIRQFEVECLPKLCTRMLPRILACSASMATSLAPWGEIEMRNSVT